MHLYGTVKTINNSAASGSATLTGLAILENPSMLLNQPMTIHFDAQFYLATECTVIASLRYFNSAQIDFESGSHSFLAQYVVCASVCFLFQFSIPFQVLNLK